MDLEELISALEPLTWVEVRPTITTRWYPGRPNEWVELCCRIKPNDKVLGSIKDSDIRQQLYLLAEEVIAIVEEMRWRHLRVPRIELEGEGVWGAGRLQIIHRCEVRLEVAQS